MINKTLIACFSRPGNNYVTGSIINLPVGNTETAARLIKELTGGDLFKIDSVNAYPDDYTDCTETAKKELEADERPELSAWPESIQDYDTLILGYPNWWGTMPMTVWTFLERYDFSGKTILPFCTHEGSGMGRSEANIRKLCPGADLKKGLAIRGSDVKNAGKAIAAWLHVSISEPL
ncbi:flavodoxin [Lachnospiraceae bacterium 54-53]